MQAKIMYSGSKYPRMDHVGQIDSLIDYAKGIDGIPLYLLYNSQDSINFLRYPDFARFSPLEIKQFGISFISAHFLKENYCNKSFDKEGKPKWKIPSFFDLHPYHAAPWNNLVCHSEATDLDSFLSYLNLKIHDKLVGAKRGIKFVKIHPPIDAKWKPLEFESELTSDKNQLGFISPGDFDALPTPKETPEEQKEKYEKFNPRFLISIDFRKNESNLSNSL
ncbi:hypothetical protein KFE98_17155 [bacterium SCSIO 12741]|nr:hypothetical protein KFE98_17155 [bacterium SCSIO 12741]